MGILHGANTYNIMYGGDVALDQKKLREESKRITQQLAREARHADAKRLKEARAIARLDINGNDLVEFCSYCGATNVVRYTHRPNRCVDCGRLYEQWRSAKRRGAVATLQRIAPEILQRMDRARSLNMGIAPYADDFYKQVKDMRKGSSKEANMEQNTRSVVTHKICKQCGRDLPIERFRQYTPRGSGTYKTTQGHYTICKDCDAISSRAAAALRRDDKDLIAKLTDYYKSLADKGLPPATAPAKKMLGVDTPKAVKANKLDVLLSATLGTGSSYDNVEVFCRKLRNREFASADDAYEQLKVHTAALKERGLYDDMNELVEDWFDE